MSAPIQRTKLYEDVADRILERVRAGTWPAGSRLPAEGELAEEFDVSRSTVRAAVRSLRIAGVLQPRNGSGTYVTDSSNLRSSSFCSRVRRVGVSTTTVTSWSPRFL